jgi:hypothetical protein
MPPLHYRAATFRRSSTQRQRTDPVIPRSGSVASAQPSNWSLHLQPLLLTTTSYQDSGASAFSAAGASWFPAPSKASRLSVIWLAELRLKVWLMAIVRSRKGGACRSATPLRGNLLATDHPVGPHESRSRKLGGNPVTGVTHVTYLAVATGVCLTSDLDEGRDRCPASGLRYTPPRMVSLAPSSAFGRAGRIAPHRCVVEPQGLATLTRTRTPSAVSGSSARLRPS